MLLRPSRQALVIAGVLLLAGAGASILLHRAKDRVIDAGFWFERVSYGSSEAMTTRLGGPLTESELQTIERGARAELIGAFQPLRIALSEDRDAMYRVRVVQELRNPRSPRYPGPAGESRSVPGLGGDGTLNFRMLVSNAVAYAPPAADRATIVEAIGKGIGRAAVHEFAHQFLGAAPIHASRDVASYEYESAGRAEQYYGVLHWDVAWPALLERVGRRDSLDARQEGPPEPAAAAALPPMSTR